MRQKVKNILLIFLFLLGVSKINAQTTIAQISFKIEYKSDGWFYASMKSSQNLNNPTSTTLNKITEMQFTIVAPLGTFSSIKNFTSTLPLLDGLTSPPWGRQSKTNATNEYIYLYVLGVPTVQNMTANVDIPLFKFQLSSCTGALRLYRNVADASGIADVQVLNSANSMFMASIASARTNAYSGNYGSSADCNPVVCKPTICQPLTVVRRTLK
ncbi:MAG: hypothetical protein ACOVQ4_22120 [Flectobacillus sp.]|uniref:hypothetical protein n=1 Tax=Flectobacillus sp. TaxID=50419 RepID=UPI003B9D324A